MKKFLDIRRLKSEESGFTLVELLVTTMMMVTVLFALYSLFDMSLRVFSLSNDRVEVNQTGRVALERMERELRMAFPGNTDEGTNTLVCTGSSIYCSPASDGSRIAFGNDLNNDRNIRDCTSPTSCSTYDARELISYFSSDPDGDGLFTVYRNDTNNPLVDLGQGGSLAFSYLDANGAIINASTISTNESKVKMIRIQMHVRVDRGFGERPLQKLTTEVTLRNRNR